MLVEVFHLKAMYLAQLVFQEKHAIETPRQKKLVLLEPLLLHPKVKYATFVMEIISVQPQHKLLAQLLNIHLLELPAVPLALQVYHAA